MIANDLSAVIAESIIGDVPTKQFGVLMHCRKSCARQAAHGHTLVARRKASDLRVHWRRVRFKGSRSGDQPRAMAVSHGVTGRWLVGECWSRAGFSCRLFGEYAVLDFAHATKKAGEIGGKYRDTVGIPFFPTAQTIGRNAQTYGDRAMLCAILQPFRNRGFRRSARSAG